MKRRNSKPEPQVTASSPVQTDLWIYVALLAAVTLLYSQTNAHGFINYDDPTYITENAQVRNGLSWAGLVWAFSGAHDGNWIPLTWLSHMLDCQLFGLRSGRHHLTSSALHGITAMLLFALFRRTTGDRWPSAFIAMSFALHPLHVESVAWAAERKDVLSALFFVATLYTYAVYVERPTAWRYGAMCALFACGLMSKSMVVTLPLVALLLDVWPLKRAQPWTNLILEKLPLLALSAAVSLVTFVAQSRQGAVAALDQVPVAVRMENGFLAYLIYAAKFVWPSGLAVVYPFTIPAAWEWILSALALAAMTAFAMRERTRRPYLAVGWLWFLGMLAPVIGLIQVGLQSHADRYMYLPSIGLSIMLAWGAAEWRWNRALFAATCSAWALVTWMDLGYWRDSATLFTRAIQVTDGNYVAYNNLGVAMRSDGRIGEAVRDFEIAEKLRPQDAELQDNLGEALVAAERIDEAAPHLTEAIRLRPAFVKAHIDAGSAFARTGQMRQAEAEYREALRLDRDSTEAHYGLGGVLTMEGRGDEARTHLEVALPGAMEKVSLNPGDADGHYNLGVLLSMMGRTGDAAAQFSDAVRLAPDDAGAHFNLGMALFELQRTAEAAEQFAAVVRLRPEDVNAHYNLGKALAAMGRKDDAAREFTEALRLRPDFEDARRSLDSLKR